MPPKASGDVDRAVSPVVGTVLLVTIAVLSAVVLASIVTDAGRSSDPPQATIEGSADGTENHVTLVHRGGDPLPITDVRLRVEIEGVPLTEQPPVPFFSAQGFAPGPTGPFNPSGDRTWESGEPASFRIASTNSPTPSPGDEITVLLLLDGQPVDETTLSA
jgi:flagellin-like protein